MKLDLKGKLSRQVIGLQTKTFCKNLQEFTVWALCFLIPPCNARLLSVNSATNDIQWLL